MPARFSRCFLGTFIFDDLLAAEVFQATRAVIEADGSGVAYFVRDVLPLFGGSFQRCVYSRHNVTPDIDGVCAHIATILCKHARIVKKLFFRFDQRPNNVPDLTAGVPAGRASVTMSGIEFIAAVGQHGR